MVHSLIKNIQAVLQKTDRITLLVFIFTFLIGFIYPIFLHPERMYFLKYFPATRMLGIDFYNTIAAANQADRTPYSPLAKILFQLFSALPWPAIYHLITLLTFGLLGLVCYAIIPRLSSTRNSLVVTIFFMALLNSYGFHFEIERGQWNLIVIVMIFSSLLAFQRGSKNWSIVLFSLAGHLKLYPFIFMPLFIVRPMFSRKNLIHFLKLIGVNLALFFILGGNVLMRYINRVVEYAGNPEVWRGNHSIACFSELINTYFFRAPYLYTMLMAFYLSLLALVFMITCRRRMAFDNKYLFFLLTIGSLIIPSVSSDYTLPALSLALLYYLLNTRAEFGWRLGLVYFALITAVFLTHFSYVHFIGPFQFLRTNKLPLLFAAAMLVSFLSVIEKEKADPITRGLKDESGERPRMKQS